MARAPLPNSPNEETAAGASCGRAAAEILVGFNNVRVFGLDNYLDGNTAAILSDPDNNSSKFRRHDDSQLDRPKKLVLIWCAFVFVSCVSLQFWLVTAVLGYPRLRAHRGKDQHHTFSQLFCIALPRQLMSDDNFTRPVKTAITETYPKGYSHVLTHPGTRFPLLPLGPCSMVMQ
uniref:Uncharacterized protein n=1 Tax=Oryza meridionalis TaxID=40149 RepID=A0A0E0DE38_9ORYZ